MDTRRTATAMVPASVATASRASFSAYLVARREARNLTLDDIARVTRIPLRSLERLEIAAFEELPADVFVRGFLRSYARCIGVDTEDAVQRYVDCLTTVPSARAAAVASLSSPSAARIDGAPVFLARGTEVVEPAPVQVTIADPGARANVDASANGDVADPVRAEPTSPSPPTLTPAKTRGGRRRGKRTRSKANASRSMAAAPVTERAPRADVAPPAAAAASPTAPTAPQSIPPAIPEPGRPTPPIAAAPSLVIDDDDPDRADRQREERAAAATDHEHGWRSFLPQSLLDDRRTRQGGLTLAVIILLIVGLITVSYLMRRPSTAGEGVTQQPRPAPTVVAGAATNEPPAAAAAAHG